MGSAEVTLRSRSVQIAGRLSYRVALIALWMANPGATIKYAMKKTGAPQAVCQRVRRDLVKLGRLKRGPKFNYEEAVT